MSRRPHSDAFQQPGLYLMPAKRIEPRYIPDPDTGCWNWQLALSKGYGREGRKYAHRVMYERMVGPIPTGAHLHHKCENKRCVNPDHLEALTPTSHLRGHWHGEVELTDEIRAQIRDAARDPQTTQQQLADRFGVPRPTVNKIIQGYSWFDGESVAVERPRCLECDVLIEDGRRHKKFCCATHRRRWNSRRRYQEAANA